jgi:phage-related tail fiber protein
MTRQAVGILLGAACAAAVVSAAWAQQNIRVRGTIERVDGPTFVVKAGEAGDMKVNLADKVGIFGVVKATLADIKPGAFIGVGATRNPTAASGRSR